MKTIIYWFTLVGICGPCVLADDTPMLNKNAHPSDMTESYAGRLGAGIIVGEPTGATVKFWLTDTLALDGAIGWSTHDHTDLYLHSDFLWHNFELIPVPVGRLPIYIGGGVLTRFRNAREDNQVGIRLPVGLAYMFEQVPLDIFAEIAPAIDLAPGVRGEITGGVGIRFWF